MSDGGKGSGRRPAAISNQQLQDNWDLIFGKGKNENGKGNDGENQERVGLEGQAKSDGERQDYSEVHGRNKGQDIE